jgi:hypothetical protein
MAHPLFLFLTDLRKENEEIFSYLGDGVFGKSRMISSLEAVCG